MSLLNYLKLLMKCKEEINPCILDTIYNASKIQTKNNISWPNWKKISTYCSNQNNFSSFMYVPLVERFISYGHTFCTHEVLSNKFSGCYLACYWTRLGFYACHIHTGNNDMKHEWNEFAKNNVDESSCVIFCPHCKDDFVYDINCIERSGVLKDKIKLPSYDYWGIISPQSKSCCSVCVCAEETYIGSNYNPKYKSKVYKIRYLKNYPLQSKLIYDKNGIPY